MPRNHLWSPRHDESSGVLTGAGGTRRFDWPACVSAANVRARRIDYPVYEELSIARVQGQATARSELLNVHPLRWPKNSCQDLTSRNNCPRFNFYIGAACIRNSSHLAFLLFVLICFNSGLLAFILVLIMKLPFQREGKANNFLHKFLFRVDGNNLNAGKIFFSGSSRVPA